MGQPMSAKGVIVPMWHRLAKAVLYLYHTARPRSITHSSPYHIYHLPIWVMQFKYIWYGAYHICPGLIFQCEFNGDVCFVIGLPYFTIISGMLIWSISYMSGTHFSIQIQWWCLFCNRTTLFCNFDQCHYWSE